MHFISSLFLNTLLLVAPLSAAADTPQCKAVPGSPSWPSTETWARLNESTGGRLLQPTPPGAVCHPSQASYNATDCSRVQAGWSTYEFHQADPVSSDWNQWNNDTCLPVPSYPCSGRGYPVFVINATTSQHVKLGVDFAREHNIRLVVKSTGHDFLGRSSGPNSLSIWTHHLKSIETHNSFRPKNCNVNIEGSSATVAAGMQMFEVYTALDKVNQTVVGGNGKTVSLGGYLTGGGHGLLSPKHGLGADNVLEMEIVTPTGDILIANECQNTDLFWAMRGGGGSTFGILTSATVRTFLSPKMVHLEWAILTLDLANPAIFDMIAYVLSQFPSLADSGLSGYAFFYQGIPNPFDGGKSMVGGISMASVLQDTSLEVANRLLEPIFTHVNKTWPGIFTPLQETTAYPTFLTWYQKNFDGSAAGTNSFFGSRLLDRPALTGNLTLNAEVFRQFAGNVSTGGIGSAFLVSGKGVHEAQPRGGSNAVLPAWRKTYVHATLVSTTAFGVPFAALNATAKADALHTINWQLEPVRKLAPDSGAYMNEATPQEPNWQHQFWGDHYERLLKIKRTVDPSDVLWCHPCVGNEGWKEVDGILCRV